MLKQNYQFLDRSRRFWSRQITIYLIIFSLTSCSSVLIPESDQAEKVVIGYVPNFLGGIAVDEPRASLVGRNILMAGGSAVDAAIAAYFVLSVTKPSAASLGGGGICLVRDAKTQKVELLDFRSKFSTKENNNAKEAAGVPGNPFGFFALHAKYGSLNWERLVQPAENLARFGFNISRSFGQDLHLAAKVLKDGAVNKSIFFTPDQTRVLGEGDFLRQTELSAILALIRSKGGTELYRGPNAVRFIKSINAVGGNISYQQLRDFRPTWRKSIRVPFLYDTTLHFPSRPGLVGLVTAQVMSILTHNNLYIDGDSDERAHLIAEAFERAHSDSSRWSKFLDDRSNDQKLVDPEHIQNLVASYNPKERVVTPGATRAELDPTSQSSGASLSVIDTFGSAVACSLSMNRPFGNGRQARGTGIFLSARPIIGVQGQSLVAMILDNKIGKNVYYASAASGGATAASALINVAADALISEDSDLNKSIAMKRVHHGGANGITYIEKGISNSILEGLAKRGHKLAYVNSMGIVNATFCKSGVPRKNPEDLNCSISTDPRGYGLASTLN